MGTKLGSKVRLPKDSWANLFFELILGFYGGATRGLFLACQDAYLLVFKPILQKLALVPEIDPPKVKDGKIKAVAVGFGRTGTYSTMLAFEELGMPTVHTINWYRDPAVLHHWHAAAIEKSREAGKIILGNPDFQKIANMGFQATADLPTAMYYEQILETFPDCKFVLTVRDNSDIWFNSWVKMSQAITHHIIIGSTISPTLRYYGDVMRWILGRVNKRDDYLDRFWLPFNLNPVKEVAVASYEAHNKRVREIIPPEQLLEYNVKEGWEPLCKFLEIAECPTTNFPKTNSIRLMQIEAISAFIAGIAFCLLIVRFVMKSFKKKNKSHKKID